MRMKKVAAAILCGLMAAGVAFAGDIAISIESRANLWTDQGFTITKGEYYTGQLMASYSSQLGGGFMRFRVNEKGQSLNLDRWSVWVKPFDFLKAYLQTAQYEFYVESIRSEPFFAAGLFETFTPKLIFELTPLKGLTVVFGVDSGLKDANKPWKTAAGGVKYVIPNVGSVAAEFAILPSFKEGVYTFGDGEFMKFGAQFQYTGVENLNVIVGYAGLVTRKKWTANNGDAMGNFAQNRAEVYASYTIGSLSLAAFDAVVIRGNHYGDLGNRFAFMASYKINQPFSVSLKAEHYYNYKDDKGFYYKSMAYPQLAGPGFDGSSHDPATAFIVQPQIDWNMGSGIGAYLGFKMTYYTSEAVPTGTSRSVWAIPLGIIVNF